MTYTRDDCICAPLDPEPDCPYHGNREIVVPERTTDPDLGEQK